MSENKESNNIKKSKDIIKIKLDLSKNVEIGNNRKKLITFLKFFF